MYSSFNCFVLTKVVGKSLIYAGKLFKEERFVRPMQSSLSNTAQSSDPDLLNQCHHSAKCEDSASFRVEIKLPKLWNVRWKTTKAIKGTIPGRDGPILSLNQCTDREAEANAKSHSGEGFKRWTARDQENRSGGLWFLIEPEEGIECEKGRPHRTSHEPASNYQEKGARLSHHTGRRHEEF